MRNWINLIETYTSDNTRLLHHLRDGEFDYYHYWPYIVDWAEETDNIDLLSHDVEDMTDFQDDPDQFAHLFKTLPDAEQKEAEEWVVEYLMRHDPAEVPTDHHLDLRSKKLLPRQTWLVHFTDHAQDILRNGFRVGMDDMNRLGLTTYFKHEYKAMGDGGYNFAFFADSRDAAFAASKRKYGKQAIMFQNSGVHAYHYGDEENQVIFYGPDVDVRSLIHLQQDGGDWYVYDHKSDRKLVEGDYKKVVAWVIANYQLYRGQMTKGYPRKR